MKLTKEEALKKIEELKKYVADEEKKGFEIKNIDGGVIYVSKADNLKDAVIEAVASEADLGGADLCGADLCGADLCGADLCGADLCGADLGGADLCGADLWKADLCGANLRKADLGEAKFYGKGGTQKLTKKQVPVFLEALGFEIV